MKNLIKELDILINIKAKQLVKDEKEYKNKYENLESTLLDMIQEARLLKEDMVTNKLTVSTIEAEGYLRFALSVENLLSNSC